MSFPSGTKSNLELNSDGSRLPKFDANGNKTITPIDTVTVKEYFNNPSLPNTLSLMTDDIVYVLSKPNDFWWDGIIVDPIGNITRGWFPPSHTQKIFCENSRNSSVSINRSLDASSETNRELYDSSDKNDSLSAISVKGGSNESFAHAVRHQSASSSRQSVLSGESSSRSDSSLSQQQQRPNGSSVISELESERMKEFNTKQSLPAAPEILHLSSAKEIQALLKAPDQVNQQSSVYFTPLWMPQLTADNNFIFHDQALNLSTYNIPLLPAEGKLFVMETPDTTAYSNGIYSVSMKLADSNQTGETSNMGFTLKNDDALRSNSESFLGNDNGFENLKAYDLSNFYLLPTDITTWRSLNRYFKRCVEFSNEALVKRDKKWFRSNLNFVSTTVATYQMIIKILADPLKAKGVSDKVALYLKKMTSSLVRFIINGNIYMMTDSNASGDQGGK